MFGEEKDFIAFAKLDNTLTAWENGYEADESRVARHFICL